MQDAENDKKLFYSIGELAMRYGVSVHTVRHWEKNFPILKPKRNKKGDRLFTKTDVENLDIIHYLLKVRKYSTAGANKRMSENKEGIGKEAEIVRRLNIVKSKLLGIAQNLDDKE